MTEKYVSLVNRFIQWEILSDKLRAAFLLGSQARNEKK